MIKKNKTKTEHSGFIFVSEFPYRQYTHLLPALGGGGKELGQHLHNLSLDVLEWNEWIGCRKTQKDTGLVQK